jgi:hypothetical protein
MMNWGYQFSRKELDLGIGYNFLTEDVFDRNLSFESSTHALFLSARQNYQDIYSFELGIRYNYLNLLNKHFLEPRFSLVYKPADPLSFKFGGGLYQQYISQLVDFHDLGINDQVWIMADGENFPIIKSSQLNFGVIYQLRNLLFEAEIYYKMINGISGVNFNLEPSLEDPFGTGEAASRGFDLMIKNKWGNYSSWLSYTLNDIDYKFKIVNQNNSFAADHDQRHSINWVHNFKIRDFELGLVWKIGSGRPYTLTRSIAENQDAKDNTKWYIVYDKENDLRLLDYHRLDFSARYKFVGDKVRGAVNVSLLNVYNRRNQLSKDYFSAFDYESANPVPEILEFNRFLLGITPNIAFRLQW